MKKRQQAAPARQAAPAQRLSLNFTNDLQEFHAGQVLSKIEQAVNMFKRGDKFAGMAITEANAALATAKMDGCPNDLAARFSGMLETLKQQHAKANPATLSDFI